MKALNSVKENVQNSWSCDNTDHEMNVEHYWDKYPQISRNMELSSEFVKMSDEFDGEVVEWCNVCQTIDDSMLSNEVVCGGCGYSLKDENFSSVWESHGQPYGAEEILTGYKCPDCDYEKKY